VHQRVQPAEAAHGLGHQLRQAVELHEVRLQHQRAAGACRLQLRGQRLRLPARAVAVQRHVVAFGVQAARDGGAQPPRGAGDQDGRVRTCHGGLRIAVILPHCRFSGPSMSHDPIPEEALAHSARLRGHIHREIAAAGGAIPFWRFMELALYAPGLGYYSAGAAKFGAAGDFVTAPELGPLFAECVAGALAPVLRQLGPGATLLEVGGGSGAFARDALAHLAELDALPAGYAILEPSADLRERQRHLLQSQLPPELSARVAWLDRPIGDAWDGVLFANEVL